MKTIKSPFKNTNICCGSDRHIGVHQNGGIWHDVVIDWAKWLRNELINNGIDDIIIGAPKAVINEEISVGKAYIIFGNSQLDSIVYTSELTKKKGVTIIGKNLFYPFQIFQHMVIR